MSWKQLKKEYLEILTDSNYPAFLIFALPAECQCAWLALGVKELVTCARKDP